MQLPIDVLKAAAVGLLIEEGCSEQEAWRRVASVADPEFQRVARKVASVAMTLQAHGLMKDRIH